MRERAIGAGGDDRAKRGVLGAQLAHALLHREPDLALRAAGQPGLGDPGVDLVGEARGGGDRLDLRLVLGAPQLLDDSGGGDELDAVGHRLLELVQVGDAGVGVVEPHAAAHAIRDRGHELALGANAVEDARDLPLGALDVAEVGGEDALVGADEADAARPAEAREPADVGAPGALGVAGAHEVADDELVEAALGDLGREPLGALGAAMGGAH